MQAVPQFAEHRRPDYLRLLRGRYPRCSTSTTTPSNSARPRCSGRHRRGPVSSGLMTMRALQAADRLAKHHVDVAVVHTPTTQPFDAETVLRELDTDRLAVTLENHTVSAGCSRRWPRGRAPRDRQAGHPDRAARRVPRRGRTADAARSIRPVDGPDRRIGARTAVASMSTANC